MSNLKAYLPFDESATADKRDVSWTATGNVSLSTEIKKFGAASVHLPNGAYLTANNIIDLNAEKWTFDCWAYLVSSSSDNGYFALSARTDASRYGIINSNDGIWIAATSSGWQAKNTSITFPSVKNQWVHLAIVKNGTTVTFYQDGASVWSFTTSALDNSGAFILGGNYYGYDTDIYFDEVRIVEGEALWTDNFTPPTETDYLKMDRVATRYLSFTGNAGCYGELPLAVLPGATTFTIEAKFSTTTTASNNSNFGWKTIVGREISSYWQDDFGLCVNGGKLCFWAEPKSGGSNSTHNTTSNATVNDGQIHEVAVVSSGGAIDLYCDGELVAHTDNVNAKIFANQTILMAYNSNSNSYLQMDLYEARFWSIARTAEEIFADIDGTEQGLEAWYIPSEDGLRDYSGNNRHATLYGSPAYTEATSIHANILVGVETRIRNTNDWKYFFNTAENLIVEGTTLTNLPPEQSITGSAFYQTQRAKCFDIPATNEIWLKFDIYFDGSNRWRAYNGGSNGDSGIASQTDGRLSYFINGGNSFSRDFSGICKVNQLQTVLLHMVSGSSDGVVEAWVDGTFIYSYTGDVNHGQDFADIYLQSDGAGTFFSSVIISNGQIFSEEGAQKVFVAVESAIRNRLTSWRYTNPGTADYFDFEGATTVKVPYTQSVTGTAFYGGGRLDMFNTPAGVKEVWIKFDLYVREYNAASVLRYDYFVYGGHTSAKLNQFCGFQSTRQGFYDYIDSFTVFGGGQLTPTTAALHKYLLHMKSGATDGLFEFTVDKETYSYTGNVNGGEDFTCLYLYSQSDYALFSNIVVSDSPVDINEGWSNELVPVETKVTAPVLNIRRQGETLKFPLQRSPKIISPAVAVRWQDRNWYNPLTETKGYVSVRHDDKNYYLSSEI